MSMSTHVVGIRPPDEKWRQMKAVWDACTKAGVEIPQDVLIFFNYEAPDQKGVLLELPSECITEYTADMRDGFEVDVTKLPSGVKVIRFYNSY